LRNKKILIVDRDPLFTREFEQILNAGGVAFKRLPSRSPNLNAYAERFVRSIKDECLNRMIFFSESQSTRTLFTITRNAITRAWTTCSLESKMN